MDALVRDNLAHLAALCQRYGVRRLELFGSAAAGRFDAAHSDLDFLVEFADLPAESLFARYFGLAEGLEALFARKVDLVMLSAVTNPHFLAEIEPTRVELYAA